MIGAILTILVILSIVLLATTWYLMEEFLKYQSVMEYKIERVISILEKLETLIREGKTK